MTGSDLSVSLDSSDSVTSTVSECSASIRFVHCVVYLREYSYTVSHKKKSL